MFSPVPDIEFISSIILLINAETFFPFNNLVIEFFIALSQNNRKTYLF